MRYPEDKIKEAILHPDIEIRDRATSYFAKSFSSDPTIMPLVIKAVETYGRQNDTYQLIGASRDLPQSEGTIAWVIDELNDPPTDQDENYAFNLSMVLVEADPALLLPRESDILEARHFLNDLHTPLVERLRMLSWDEATCWRKLEEFCEEGKDKQYTNQINLGYANRIVEALARYGKDCEAKVHAVLSQKVDDFQHHPMKWLEPLTVRLSGEARLESTIPLLVGKLNEHGDMLGDTCQRALSQIGTPAVLEAVAEAYPKAPRHFRLYGSGPLEYIHSDLAVEKCLLLLPQETEWDLKRNLAHSLLSHFPLEGIEVVRQMLVGRELDADDRYLLHYLVETGTIMGDLSPEHNELSAAEKTKREEDWKRVKELETEIAKKLLEIKRLQAQIAEQKKAHPGQVRPQAPRLPHSRESSGGIPPIRKPNKVGRNDSCPCGSGKKFKNCCLKK